MMYVIDSHCWSRMNVLKILIAWSGSEWNSGLWRLNLYKDSGWWTYIVGKSSSWRLSFNSKSNCYIDLLHALKSNRRYSTYVQVIFKFNSHHSHCPNSRVTLELYLVCLSYWFWTKEICLIVHPDLPFMVRQPITYFICRVEFCHSITLMDASKKRV